ncbi:MAG: hypothetical protein AB7F35_16060, partial [Acetobacteraceae bacterium]
FAVMHPYGSQSQARQHRRCHMIPAALGTASWIAEMAFPASGLCSPGPAHGVPRRSISRRNFRSVTAISPGIG